MKKIIICMFFVLLTAIAYSRGIEVIFTYTAPIPEYEANSFNFYLDDQLLCNSGEITLESEMIYECAIENDFPEGNYNVFMSAIFKSGIEGPLSDPFPIIITKPDPEQIRILKVTFQK